MIENKFQKISFFCYFFFQCIKLLLPDGENVIGFGHLYLGPWYFFGSGTIWSGFIRNSLWKLHNVCLGCYCGIFSFCPLLFRFGFDCFYFDLIC